MLIADAHLDLAYNALRGRNVLAPAADQAPDQEGIPSVGLPDLRAGGVGLICATIFAEPASRNAADGYATPDQAARVAQDQLNWYQAQAAEGQLRLVSRGSQLPLRPEHAVATILLMEGADPLRNADDVRQWHQAGLRVVGLAWKRTRYAGGTNNPGPITAEGVELVRVLDSVDMIHDVSHLADESFWQLMDLTGGPVMASHSNCRAIVPSDRQLADEMIRAIVARGGVIGINLYDKFLLAPEELGRRRATMADVVRHVRHICELAGDADHVALGTDMDGGFGQLRIPVEIKTSADLPRLAAALGEAGFGDEDVAGIMGENWVRFFRASLPM